MHHHVHENQAWKQAERKGRKKCTTSHLGKYHWLFVAPRPNGLATKDAERKEVPAVLVQLGLPSRNAPRVALNLLRRVPRGRKAPVIQPQLGVLNHSASKITLWLFRIVPCGRSFPIVHALLSLPNPSALRIASLYRRKPKTLTTTKKMQTTEPRCVPG